MTNLAARWQQDTIDLKPDLLGILVGVNDATFRVTPEEFGKQYDKLLADTVATLPNVRLVLGEPFTLPTGRHRADWDTWRPDMEPRQQIVGALAAKYHAALIRYQHVFDEAAKRAAAECWIWDGIHPTYSGHQLMADEWERTVRKFWRR